MGPQHSGSLKLGLLLSALAALLAPVLVAADETPLAGNWLDAAAADVAWTSDAVSSTNDGSGTEAVTDDPGIELTQMLTPGFQAPATRQPVRVAQAARRPALGAAAGSSLASIPYMIGDTNAGTCTTFGSFFLDADIAHPTLACSRLNVADNNTPFPVDRWYFSYRHFHNATTVRYFDDQTTVNLDSFVLGGEHAFLNDLCSVEVRLPIEGRLNSELKFRDSFSDQFDGFNDLRSTELGNVSTLFKMLLVERPNSALSAGVGVTLPTAQDVHIRSEPFRSRVFDVPFQGNIVRVDNFLFAPLGLTASNETIYLSPFLAWYWAPRPRWFHQGFCQVEVAANPSTVSAVGTGRNDFFVNGQPLGFAISEFLSPAQADLHAQTLMRLNLGSGYILKDDAAADWIQRLTALFEVHYTTTLEDAKFASIPIRSTAFDPFGQPIIFDFISPEVTVGNAANRVDIVNLALGLQANAGRFVITNGFVVPIRDDSDRGFDFEYNLQVNRPF